MSLPPGAREIDPEAEMAKHAINRDLRVIDEIHRACDGDGGTVSARITVTASRAHPLPLGLLESLIDGLREAWLEGRNRAGGV